MPFCGLSQNAGAVCELPDSAISTFWPTFCALRPICCRRARVHVEIDRRRVQALVHVAVDGAGNVLDLLGQRGRERGVGVDVVAGELHVDGRGQAEVQDLRDDVGRLEEELDAGEAPGQFAPQDRDELRRGLVILLQRDLDLAVQRADRAGVAVRQVDAGVGHAQVVQHCLQLVGRHQFADRGLDFVGGARGFLDARAGGQAHVQAHLAGIDGREEVAPPA